MINMPHCRFQNTLESLQECYETLSDGSCDPLSDLSKSEQAAARRLFKLCARVLDDYADEADEKQNKFDPLNHVPKNDQEAEIAIKFQKGPLVGDPAWRLYQMFREHDGDTVEKAYERALLAILGEN